MGRVARHKRHKTLGTLTDPHTDRLKHLAPRADDDKRVSKAIERFVKMKQTAMTKPAKMKADDDMAHSKEQGRRERKPKTGVGSSSNHQDTNTEIKELKIKPRESLAAFGRRVDNAARAQLFADSHRHTNKAAKRKDWSAMKAAKLKEKRSRKLTKQAESKDDLFGKVDKVEFGEVAMAPPQLKQKPKVKQTLKRAPLLLADKLKTPSIAPIRKAMLESERDKAIKAYRELQRSKRVNPY